MSNISDLIIPLIVLMIISYAIIKKNNVYDDFIEGSKESIVMCLNMFPTLLAMILGVNIFVNSNFLTEILQIFEPLFNVNTYEFIYNLSKASLTVLFP